MTLYGVRMSLPFFAPQIVAMLPPFTLGLFDVMKSYKLSKEKVKACILWKETHWGQLDERERTLELLLVALEECDMSFMMLKPVIDVIAVERHGYRQFPMLVTYVAFISDLDEPLRMRMRDLSDQPLTAEVQDVMCKLMADSIFLIKLAMNLFRVSDVEKLSEIHSFKRWTALNRKEGNAASRGQLYEMHQYLLLLHHDMVDFRDSAYTYSLNAKRIVRDTWRYLTAWDVDFISKEEVFDWIFYFPSWPQSKSSGRGGVGMEPVDKLMSRLGLYTRPAKLIVPPRPRNFNLVRLDSETSSEDDVPNVKTEPREPPVKLSYKDLMLRRMVSRYGSRILDSFFMSRKTMYKFKMSPG
jgi:hypothetical protein